MGERPARLRDELICENLDVNRVQRRRRRVARDVGASGVGWELGLLQNKAK
jgi:hypothetical protein